MTPKLAKACLSHRILSLAFFYLISFTYFRIVFFCLAYYNSLVSDNYCIRKPYVMPNLCETQSKSHKTYRYSTVDRLTRLKEHRIESCSVKRHFVDYVSYHVIDSTALV